MILELRGTKVFIVDGTLGYQGDNLVNTIQVTVDKDSTWNYKLDMYKGKSKCFDSVLMTRDGNVCTVQLTNEILSYGGRYIFQLRGYTDTQTYHSDIFESWVNASIEYQDDCKQACECDCKLPTEFYQVEDNVTEINNHPPYPGDNGKWMIWDVNKHEYVESDIEVVGGKGSEPFVINVTGTSVGENEYDCVSDKTFDEIQEAIKENKNILCLFTASDFGNEIFYFELVNGNETKLTFTNNSTAENKILYVNRQNQWIYDHLLLITTDILSQSITEFSSDSEVPSAKAVFDYVNPITSDYSLGIYKAKVGDGIKVKAVDDIGSPTEWEPAQFANKNGRNLDLEDIVEWTDKLVVVQGDVGYCKKDDKGVIRAYLDKDYTIEIKALFLENFIKFCDVFMIYDNKIYKKSGDEESKSFPGSYVVPVFTHIDTYLDSTGKLICTIEKMRLQEMDYEAGSESVLVVITTGEISLNQN